MESQRSISTGSLSLDSILGCGGYPRGRIVELSGPRHSGKTTLALQAIAKFQRVGGVAALIDADHRFDLQYAQAMGVDCARLLVGQPDNAAQAFDIIKALIRSCAVELIVVNSAAAMLPRSASASDDDAGYRSRLLHIAFNELCVLAHRYNVTLLVIHQHEAANLVSEEARVSGIVLKYYASVRLDVRRITGIQSGESAGHLARVKVLKNKFAAPFVDTVVDVCCGTRVDRALA
jgi:recombination protein RecA